MAAPLVRAVRLDTAAQVDTAAAHLGTAEELAPARRAEAHQVTAEELAPAVHLDRAEKLAGTAEELAPAPVRVVVWPDTAAPGSLRTPLAIDPGRPAKTAARTGS